MSTAAVFFDRDGVINVSPGDGYVTRWKDFHFADGAIDAIKLCKARGYKLVIVTSQQGVGKGLMSQAALDEIHQRMEVALGFKFDRIETCTHLTGTCTCRKPSPEMVQRAAALLDLDLTQSWLIGDHDRDIEMARNAGVPNTIRVLSHHEPRVQAMHTVASTNELVALLSRLLPDLS
jgi:histidinol-phosphate phosphatase family protein